MASWSEELYDEDPATIVREAESRLGRDPDDPIARHNLAVGRYLLGDHEGAERALAPCLAHPSPPVRSLLLHGMILEASGRLQEAIHAYEAAAAADPGWASVWARLGLARYEAGDRTGAQDAFQEAARRAPDSEFIQYDLGLLAAKNGDWETARCAITRCLELDPGDAAHLAAILVEIGRGQAEEETHRFGHRLKNALGVAGAGFRRLAAELPPAEASRLMAQVDRIQALHEELSLFLRLLHRREPRLAVVDPNRLVQRVLVALSPRLETVTVVRRAAVRPPSVIGDEALLEEAVGNLILNAVEAIDEEGRIEVSVLVEAGGDEVVIEVADDGRGIAPRDRDRIFLLGYTTKRFGSGVGLPLTARIVRRHGGRMEVRSTPGRGSRFRIVLPVVRRRREEAIGFLDLDDIELRPILLETVAELLVPDSDEGNPGGAS